MNTISIILLLLLLNTILGCMATYKFLERVTLYDLIMSTIAGVFVFMFTVSYYTMSWIENKTSGIVLIKETK